MTIKQVLLLFYDFIHHMDCASTCASVLVTVFSPSLIQPLTPGIDWTVWMINTFTVNVCCAILQCKVASTSTDIALPPNVMSFTFLVVSSFSFLHTLLNFSANHVAFISYIELKWLSFIVYLDIHWISIAFHIVYSEHILLYFVSVFSVIFIYEGVDLPGMTHPLKWFHLPKLKYLLFRTQDTIPSHDDCHTFYSWLTPVDQEYADLQ